MANPQFAKKNVKLVLRVGCKGMGVQVRKPNFPPPRMSRWGPSGGGHVSSERTLTFLESVVTTHTLTIWICDVFSVTVL